jgi:hypothetical protein
MITDVIVSSCAHLVSDGGRLYVRIDLAFQPGKRVGIPEQQIGDPIGGKPFYRFVEVVESGDKIELQLGVAGRVRDDGGHAIVSFICNPKYLTDGVLVAEVFFGGRGSEDDVILTDEGIGIALEDGEGKYSKEGRIGVKEIILFEMVHTLAHNRSANVYVGERLDVGKYRPEAGANDGAGKGGGKDSTAAGDFHGHAGDTVGIGMKPVEAKFVGDEEPDKDTAGEADGQAEDIDKGKGLFPEEVSEGEFKVVPDHM